MSGFTAQWLALREPYDLRARNPQVLAAAVALFAKQPSVTIVDLACGAGSTLRALSPHLPIRQNWRLIDNDLGLLARAAATSRPERATVTATPIDLAHDLEAALDGPVDLVTTSALLDLVSADWLNRLVVEIAARRLPLYAALTYNGQADLQPPAPLDGQIIAAVNAHQRSDKGFGPALGPEAAEATIAQFKAVGYAVTTGASDWRFAPSDRAIQTEIVDGWAGAAQATGRLAIADVAGWLAERRAAIASGALRTRVGHIDVLVHPPLVSA